MSNPPGLGCGPTCTLCRQPLAIVEMLNPLEIQARRDLYESGRRVWREINNIPSGGWRKPDSESVPFPSDRRVSG